MTPERVAEIAQNTGCHAGCDRDNHHIRWSIRAAVNEALEEAAKKCEKKGDSLLHSSEKDAYICFACEDDIRALKLPEE